MMFFANKFNHVFILIIFCIFLSSCGPSPDEPIATATPSPTIKPAPTFTPAPIVSPTIEANYSFRLDSEIVDVFWNDDGSLSLSYAFTFANDPSVSPIDYVDINIPSQNFLLEDITALVNGNNILHIEESSYFPSSIELGLNQNSIQPGETGIVSAQIDHIQDVLIIDPEEYQYVRALFFPTWFSIDFCHGITDMTVIFHFPPGVQTTEVHLHQLPPGWFGEPIYDEDELGQLTMTLNNPSANGFTQYLFEISFPKSHIPESAIVQLNQLDTMYSYAYNKRGLEYLQSNDFENAYEDFSSAIAIDNELSEAYALRGEVIWRSSTNYDDALVNLNKSIELDPSKEGYYVTRGIIFDLKGEYEEAMADYNRAIELNPGFAYAYSHRGITLRDHGEYEKALRDFDMAIELNPTDAQAYYNRGTSYQYRGEFDVFTEDYDAALADYDAAIADYDTAIEKDEEFEWAYYYKGQILQTLQRYDEAVLEYSKVLDLNPSHPDAFQWRGYCFMVLGDYKSAEDDLQTSLDILTERVDGTVFYLLGVIYTITGRTEKAIESFELALSLPLGIDLIEDANNTLIDLVVDEGRPWFGKPICARDTDGDFDPDLLTTGFITDDPFGYVEFPYQNMVEGTPWKYIWTSEDGIIYENAGIWDDSISGLHITYFTAPSFGPGKWIFSLYFKDDLVRETECWVDEP